MNIYIKSTLQHNNMLKITIYGKVITSVIYIMLLRIREYNFHFFPRHRMCQYFVHAYLYSWKDGWLASMATEIGPTVATAAWRSSSEPAFISIQLFSVAPTSASLNLHFPFWKQNPNYLTIHIINIFTNRFVGKHYFSICYT